MPKFLIKITHKLDSDVTDGGHGGRAAPWQVK